MKTCPTCKRHLPLAEFCKDAQKADGLSSPCRSCRQAYHRRRFETDANYRRRCTTRKTEWVGVNRERYDLYQRAWHLASTYGLTTTQYDALLAAQGGTCAMCPATERDSSGARLSVDHDHATGEVRGILCLWCNNLLSELEAPDAAVDPVAMARLAIDYLTVPPARKVLGT